MNYFLHQVALQSEANKGTSMPKFDKEVSCTYRNILVVHLSLLLRANHQTDIRLLVGVYEKRMQISGIFPCKVQNPAQTRRAVSLTENISGSSWYVNKYIYNTYKYITHRILYINVYISQCVSPHFVYI